MFHLCLFFCIYIWLYFVIHLKGLGQISVISPRNGEGEDTIIYHFFVSSPSTFRGEDTETLYISGEITFVQLSSRRV